MDPFTLNTSVATVAGIFCWTRPFEPGRLLEAKLEAIHGRHMVSIRNAVPSYDIGYPSSEESRAKFEDGLLAMAVEMMDTALQGMLDVMPNVIPNASVYEKPATRLHEGLRDFIWNKLFAFVGESYEYTSDSTFTVALFGVLDASLHKMVTKAWSAHEEFFRHSSSLKVPAEGTLPADQKTRLKATITSVEAARRMNAYLDSKKIGLTEFATRVGITDRTLRSFRKTGKIRRDLFDSIAKEMGMTRDELLKAPE
jgi:DNA-binding Xre family transcriptional regulator